MTWHVLTSTFFDFEQIAEANRADLAPQHLITSIAADLNGTVHQPRQALTEARYRLRDRLAALIYGQPKHWELARQVRKRLEAGDRVYASGDDVGVPLGLICAFSGARDIPIAITMIDPARFRSRVMGSLLSLILTRFLVIVPTQTQADELFHSFGWGETPVVCVDGQTDTDFFRPLTSPKAERGRPLIVSCGAEQRDYRILAQALEDKDVDVRICLASPNLSNKTRITLPMPVPDNFDIRYFSFAELRTLYQQADVVVVPLLENRYSAGLTTILEAVACGTPVVTTKSVGVIGRLIDRGLVVGVAPGDAPGLADAVQAVLADPARAAERARIARHTVLDELSSERYRLRLQRWLTTLNRNRSSSVPRIGPGRPGSGGRGGEPAERVYGRVSEGRGGAFNPHGRR